MTAADWSRMSMSALAGSDRAGSVVVLPLAAVEQHGPHLPTGVDALINQGILGRALARVPDELSVLVLPMQSVGKSNEHQAFPGTLSLSAQTLIHVITDLGESVHRSGFRRLLLFNSHGGNPPAMELVATDLRVRLGMLVVCCSWHRLGLPEGAIAEHERRHGIHGGEIETAMMLHLHPELVDMGQAQDFETEAARLAEQYRHLHATGGITFGWQTQDLHPSGACGNARRADAATGQRLVEHAAQQLVVLFQDIAHFDLDRLQTGPMGLP